MNLYPYQNRGVQTIRQNFKDGQTKTILVAPTGSGKTVIFSFMALSAANKGLKVLILANRRKLVKQAEIQHQNITVVTVQSKKFDLNNFDLMIIDECHFTDFDNYVEAFNGYVVGFTATPIRTNKQRCLSTIYNSMVDLIQVQELIDQGFLAAPICFGKKLDLSKVLSSGGDFDGDSLAQLYKSVNIYDHAINEYKRLANNKKAIVFAPNRESGKEITQLFINEGYQAFYVDYKIKEVDEITKQFEATESGILVNYALYTTGYDHKPIEVVMLLRATKSLSTFMQMVGRGSRITENKKTFYLLDFGNNILRHGLWQQHREWTITKQKSKDKLGLAPVKICPKCGFMNNPTAKICEVCKTKLPEPKKKKVKYSDLLEQLEQVDKVLSKEVISTLRMAKNKGYKLGWVMHKLDDTQKIEFCKYMGYDRRFSERF